MKRIKKHTKMINYVKKNYRQEPNPQDRLNKIDEDNAIESESEFKSRDEFTRDKDRIIHTKAFRRLQHKAQVYSNEDSDHYRTRLTHTLEVNQIAKAIARNLGVNEDLTEAIALGHDIGHTPFGHAGEKVIDDILRGNDELGGKLKYALNYGGFKHNFNSLKILDVVEQKYEGNNGLNLTWQVLDGICKHTKIIKDDKKWDWRRYVSKAEHFNEIINYDYPNNIKLNDKLPQGIPLTIEGQIVQLADEIAQREHDLDDGFRGENEDKFNKLQKIMDNAEESIKGDMDGYQKFCKLKKDLDIENIIMDIRDKKLSEGELDLKWNTCIRNIVSYFIMDVSEKSLDNIYNSKEKEVIFKNNNRKYIIKKLVDFSVCAEELNKSMKLYIENRIINSYEVNCFDGKGEYILRQLFKAYYKNPKQMPPSELKILEKRIEKNSADYKEIKINGKKLESIKFIPSSFEEKIDLKDMEDLISSLKLKSSEFNSLYEKEIDLNKIIDENSDDKLKHYLENHYAYLYVISDYISKMTDNYAEKQYIKLYLKS